MKHLFTSVAGAGLLLFSMAASQAAAQNHDEDSYYQTREQFYRGTEWHMHLFDRVRDDLNYVESRAFHGSDLARIDHTKTELNELQDKMVAHNFDQRELDDVIGSLTTVVSDNRLDTHDRDMLSDDLSRVRDYRDHHDNWR